MSHTPLVTDFFKMKANFFHVDLLEGIQIMSRSEFFLLHQIRVGQQAHETVCVSQLAKHLRISNPAVSKTVKSLVEKQWVTRREDSEDRRNAWLELTPLGLERHQEVVVAINQVFEQVFNQMDPQAIRQFIETGNQIAQAMQIIKQTNASTKSKEIED